MHQNENSHRVRQDPRFESDRPPQMSRSPSVHREKVQMRAKHLTAKPKSWSSEEYKDMKQYFMNWYMEVLKKQHEMEHGKSGKNSREAPVMPPEDWVKMQENEVGRILGLWVTFFIDEESRTADG
jgi:hypothetical protein